MLIFRLLWVIPFLPFAGFLLLTLAGRRMPRRGIALIGVGSVGLAMLLAFLLGAAFLTTLPAGSSSTQTLWTWMRVGAFAPSITFRLDALSLVMIVVVTLVGFLVHLYSAGYMGQEEGYRRFFAYMNLFVASMLVLVLADNLLLLYVGWEGVGLCSYLLIGFWYQDSANGKAAMKAFLVTRIGDTALAVALFALFTALGTLEIQQVMQNAVLLWAPGSTIAIVVAALLLGGAVGKSAQLPLQTWLPDAMAGPTPVSALLHAATMVTAGVYLIARLHVLFSLAPPVQFAVALIGTLTLLLASFSALTQSDVKRVLAYSTMSQIGYMFLALGVGAWSAAIFHFFTHAFFKSLLFLGAGMIITSLHEEHHMEKMGGLHRKLPLVFWTFLIGALSLSAFPLLTAGYYSKDAILYDAWASSAGSRWLWAGGWVAAVLTGLYSFRMVFLIFFGKEKLAPVKVGGLVYTIPLLTLAALSLLAGLVRIPMPAAPALPLTEFVQQVLPPVHLIPGTPAAKLPLQIAAALASLAGIALAYLFFLRAPARTARLAHTRAGTALAHFWFIGWGFDWLYRNLFVRPYCWFAAIDRRDAIDTIYTGFAWLMVSWYHLFSHTQNGRVRRYATAVVLGAVLLLALMLYLDAYGTSQNNPSAPPVASTWSLPGATKDTSYSVPALNLSPQLPPHEGRGLGGEVECRHRSSDVRFRKARK